MTDLTVQDLVTAIGRVHRREALEPMDWEDEYLELINEGLGLLSDAGLIEGSWTGVAISGGKLLLPNDCLLPLSVEYPGVTPPLTKKTLPWWDEHYSDWRSGYGTPEEWACDGRYVYFRPLAGDDAASATIVRGWGSFPEAVLSAEAENPLELLAGRFQRAPQYYALSALPCNREIALQAERRAFYTERWNRVRDALLANTGARQNMQYTGR